MPPSQERSIHNHKTVSFYVLLITSPSFSQVSGYSDVGRSFNATAGFKRKDRAPGVGSSGGTERWMASMVDRLVGGLAVDGNGRLVVG